MILLTAQNISKTYMERKVLDDVSFFLNEGDKVGIIGINGTGKSTLLKILAGAEESDSGDIIRTNGIRISYLPQIPEFGDSGTILEQVLLHLPKDLRQAKEYEARSVLEKLGISDQERDISTLSGGEKRRAGIAAALVQPSDVLLLDEPTNHIDNETAQLLEDLLMKYRGAIVMVTHDRYFLNKICRKIVEIDRGKLYVCDGSYSDYLMQKAQREADAEAAERKNRSLYRRELEWISRGARARGTKSKDRIERFEALKNRELPVAAEKVQLQSVSSRLGKKTIEIENISKSIDGKPILTDFSYIISRDARIGIVGRNGAGKSTFLKMLIGQTAPDSGSIVIGDTVNIGYFSQECESMDPTMKVIEYIRETADIVRTPDGTVTAAQMLERFLFPPALQYTPVKLLSGGEKRMAALAVDQRRSIEGNNIKNNAVRRHRDNTAMSPSKALQDSDAWQLDLVVGLRNRPGAMHAIQGVPDDAVLLIYPNSAPFDLKEATLINAEDLITQAISETSEGIESGRPQMSDNETEPEE